eukprot:5709980-Prorocentrum_lima.AAC.1
MFAPELLCATLADVFHVGRIALAVPGAFAASRSSAYDADVPSKLGGLWQHAVHVRHPSHCWQ